MTGLGSPVDAVLAQRLAERVAVISLVTEQLGDAVEPTDTCRPDCAVGGVARREDQAFWRSQNAFLPRASDLWVQASLDYRQRLQALFFPEGIAYDRKSIQSNLDNGTTFQLLGAGTECGEG